MEKLDNVSQKILDDAEEEKNKIIEEAKKKAEDIISQAKKKKDETLRMANNQAQQEYDRIYDLEIIKAKSDIGQKILLNKLELVEDIINKAKEKLKNLDKAQYKNFLIKSLKGLDIEEGEYILGKNENNIIPEILEEAAASIKLKKSGQKPDFDKGVKIISGNAEYNLSPDTLVDTNIEDIKMEIAEFLFN